MSLEQEKNMMNEQKAKPELSTDKSPILPGMGLALSRLAKPAVLLTLGIGMYLHFTHLFLGTELLIKTIYTATFDAIFASTMLLGVISFIPAWKCIVFRNTFEKVVVAITGMYFWRVCPYIFKPGSPRVQPTFGSFLYGSVSSFSHTHRCWCLSGGG